MEIIKGNEKNEKGQETVELVNGNKHFRMTMGSHNQLEVSFFYDDKDGFWFQEGFEVLKGDGEAYKAVDGTFLSYGGDVFFDTFGANLVLLNNEGNYKFLFMKEFNEASKEITCKFFDESVENNSMMTLFNKLAGKEEKKEKPQVLGKVPKN